MERIAGIVVFMVLGVVAWGCFCLLVGSAKPPRGPVVVGWKARMLGLLGIMTIPVSWTFAYIVLLVALVLDAHPSGEFVVIVADVGALIAVFVAMYGVARRWERMERAEAPTD